eukprot:TRINITY_DN30017_c0_g1_i1.p1 TRINITY_DN30017_c0_g1~~TRINITY_DN30017_c0_g1_i1.p1  ORF type:complete len:715 (-),score=102.39 TRINITY_DN30017_c0_g1_i1:180-2324(-)
MATHLILPARHINGSCLCVIQGRYSSFAVIFQRRWASTEKFCKSLDMEAIADTSMLPGSRRAPSLRRCASALRSLAGARDWQRAVTLVAEMVDMKLQTDAVCQNAAIAGCARAAAWQFAVALLAAMPGSCLQADVISYNASITACARAKYWEIGLQLFTEMTRQHGLRASPASWGAAIGACERGSAWQGSLQLLDDAQKNDFEPNLMATSAAITSCGRGSRWDLSIRILDNAKKKGLPLDVITYNCALGACNRARRWESSVALLSDMEVSHVQPDSISYKLAGAAFPGTDVDFQRQGTAATFLRDASSSADDRLQSVVHRTDSTEGSDCSRERAVASLPPGSVVREVRNCQIASDLPSSAATPFQTATDAWSSERSGFNCRAAGHAPVLSQSVVEALVARGCVAGTFADCTFGRGGHTRAILQALPAEAKLLAFDVDPSAISEARRLAASDPRLLPVHRPFGDLEQVLIQWDATCELAGVLADLGVSSPQLDQKHRGFSPIEDGPLDLRMNPFVGIPASEWLASVSAEELAWVLHAYGEDADPILAARLAEAVVARARMGNLRRTTQLAEIVAAVKQQTGGCSPFEQPARLTFQAIRSHLNQEFQQIHQLLSVMFPRLAFGGRAVIICFKRAEVALVRNWLRQHDEYNPSTVQEWTQERLSEAYPLSRKTLQEQHWCAAETRPPIVPSSAELRSNTRARSARALVLEKRPRAAK